MEALAAGVFTVLGGIRRSPSAWLEAAPGLFQIKPCKPTAMAPLDSNGLYRMDPAPGNDGWVGRCVGEWITEKVVSLGIWMDG